MHARAMAIPPWIVAMGLPRRGCVTAASKRGVWDHSVVLCPAVRDLPMRLPFTEPPDVQRGVRVEGDHNRLVQGNSSGLYLRRFLTCPP